MAVMVLVMLAACIGIPLACAWRVFRLDEASRAAWLLAVADAASLSLLVLLVGRWDMAGYHARVVLLALFLAAVLWSSRRHIRRPWSAPPSILRSRPQSVASVLLLGAALGYVGYGLLPPEKPQELAFPLSGGRFVVGQGGGIGLLNHHHGHREQRHAVDITAVDSLGFRAAGLLPKALDRYVVFGAPVISPCAGTVVGRRDGLPDLAPPDADPEHPRGNHVIIDCGSFNVELAHLRNGSVGVATGDRLSAGDPVGRVGNSGNTTEPHLHLHAVDPERGVGVPVSFQGRHPVRNRLYRN